MIPIKSGHKIRTKSKDYITNLFRKYSKIVVTVKQVTNR